MYVCLITLPYCGTFSPERVNDEVEERGDKDMLDLPNEEMKHIICTNIEDTHHNKDLLENTDFSIKLLC